MTDLSPETELANKLAAIPLDQMHSEWPTIAPVRLSETERELLVNLLRRSRVAPTPDLHAPAGCAWPDKLFTFRDEPGEHDPCYVVMPDGAMLALNHHAGDGVDVARAKFIVAACNAFMAPDFPRDVIAQAMQDAWNTICTDTDCHPLDITRQGNKLFFKPAHWVDLIALFLAPQRPALEPVAWRYRFVTSVDGDWSDWFIVDDVRSIPSRADQVVEPLYAASPNSSTDRPYSGFEVQCPHCESWFEPEDFEEIKPEDAPTVSVSSPDRASGRER